MKRRPKHWDGWSQARQDAFEDGVLQRKPNSGWTLERFRQDTFVGPKIERLVRKVWDVEFGCWVREEAGRRYVCVFIGA